MPCPTLQMLLIHISNELKVILSNLAKTSKTEIIFNSQQHYVSKKLQGQMIQEKITTGVEKLCKWVVKMSCQAEF